MISISKKLLIVPISALLTVCMSGLPSHADTIPHPNPTSATNNNSSSNVGIDGSLRSVSETETGLKLTLAQGDNIKTDGNAVFWFSKDGNLVAQLSGTSEQHPEMALTYNPSTQTLSPTSPSAEQVDLNQIQERTANNCMPKWWAWAWNITWGGLVCLPLSVGASGVGTPIAGALTASACEAAGGALTTAASC